MLKGKRILLGITGGIAAYKAAGLARELTTRGAEVRVIMTRAATEFIGPPTLQALSGHPVLCEGGPTGGDGMDHIAAARWCDALLVAPATADFLAELAHGLAGNVLSTTCLALEHRPLLLAPAMNRAMWQHPATRNNVRLLADRGTRLLGPASGLQACGEEGPGRMLEPAELITALEQTLAPGRLAGRRLLVSAGPTHEPIDPVRYLGNRSSGRMGYAVAAAAAEAGASVTLVSGPVALSPPPGVPRLLVETARQMHQAVLAQAPDHDIFIAAAAVADFGLDTVPATKHKGSVLRLELTRNPDVLVSVAELAERRPYLVGFAAETEQLRERAVAKRQAKGLDMIVANQVGHDRGFGDVQTRLLVLWEGGSVQLQQAPKPEQARRLLALVAEHYDTNTHTAARH